jgi:hypothetical protein
LRIEHHAKRKRRVLKKLSLLCFVFSEAAAAGSITSVVVVVVVCIYIYIRRELGRSITHGKQAAA